MTMTVQTLSRKAFIVSQKLVKSSFRVSTKVKKQKGSNKYVKNEQTKIYGSSN